MQRNTAIALGVAAAGLAVAIDVLWARKREAATSFTLEQRSDLSPDTVLDRIIDVESEVDTVPFVDRVDIIERGPDWVRYEVSGDALGLEWWMRYLKSWDRDHYTAKWASETGVVPSIGDSGRITIDRSGDGSIIRLDSHYSVQFPVARRLIEIVLRPVLSFVYGTWLYRVAVPQDKMAERLTQLVQLWRRS